MNEIKIEGKVVKVLETRGGTSQRGNQWKTVEMVIEYMISQEKVKQIKLEFGPAVELADNAINNLMEGTEATFSIDLECREYQGKWYNSTRCWKFEAKGVAPIAQPQPQMAQPTPTLTPTPNPTPAQPTPYSANNNSFQESGNSAGGSNDLPF